MDRMAVGSYHVFNRLSQSSFRDFAMGMDLLHVQHERTIDYILRFAKTFRNEKASLENRSADILIVIPNCFS